MSSRQVHVSKDSASFRKAAEQGDASAQNQLAICYAEGKGVPKDDVEAVTWFRKAAEQGAAEAQYNLAMCYAEGTGVPKDDDQAVGDDVGHAPFGRGEFEYFVRNSNQKSGCVKICDYLSICINDVDKMYP